MEPSKIFGGTEDCYSSESGWTMYIGSPIYGGDDDDNGGGGGGHTEADDDYGADNGGRGHADDGNHEADTDDSMASDASSGPSHQGQFYGNTEGGGHHGTTSDFKQDEDEEEEEEEEERHDYLDKKGQKSMEKKKLEIKNKEEKQQMAKGASSQSRSGSKVKKSIWRGKRN